MEEDRKYPILVLCNGTGVPLSKYESLARHYASWGFVVIGTEGEYAWNGFGAEMCVRHLERLEEMKTIEENNTQKENPFYHRLDLDRIGMIGHSQGAAGVFNAITAQPHHEIYKAAVALLLTNLQLAENLEWDYDPKKVETPVLLISGAGGGDDWVVTGDQLKEIYNEIPSSKVMARRVNTPHAEVLYEPDGYTTAWMLWILCGDEEAAKAFTGNNPELLSKKLYQDGITKQIRTSFMSKGHKIQSLYCYC